MKSQLIGDGMSHGRGRSLEVERLDGAENAANDYLVNKPGGNNNFVSDCPPTILAHAPIGCGSRDAVSPPIFSMKCAVAFGAAQQALKHGGAFAADRSHRRVTGR